jgi:hypothetical protein
MCLGKPNREETSFKNKEGKNCKNILGQCKWGMATLEIRRTPLRSCKKISGRSPRTATDITCDHTTFVAP